MSYIFVSAVQRTQGGVLTGCPPLCIQGYGREGVNEPITPPPSLSACWMLCMGCWHVAGMVAVDTGCCLLTGLPCLFGCAAVGVRVCLHWCDFVRRSLLHVPFRAISNVIYDTWSLDQVRSLLLCSCTTACNSGQRRLQLRPPSTLGEARECPRHVALGAKDEGAHRGTESE